MTDFLMLKQLHRMIKEIPKPRLMFRKGIFAEGFFRPYMSFSDYTESEIFSSFDEVTPVTVRFASMLGNKGTADTVRNIKGMSVKFQSDEEYDMICHSMPVFFINEDTKFFSMLKAFTKREYFDGINNTDFWRFIVENPEAANCAIRLFSYEGLSSSFIDMSWFSANLTVWKNSKGKRFLVRYKWIPIYEEKEKTEKGRNKVDRISAEFIAGFDSDRASNELESAVSSGNFPKFELYVQMLDYDRYNKYDYVRNTLIWEDETVSPVAAGIMRLTGIPDDRQFKRDMVSFAPGNTAKGIELYSDGFNDMMNYIYQIEAFERGECE